MSLFIFFKLVYENELEPFMKMTVDDKKPDLQKNKALQDFRELFFKQEDCDITFIVKEQKFPAHKLILKARSPVFAAALRNNMKERETGIYNVEDCEPAHFLDFLHFLYCGEEKIITAENVFNLFTIADKYDVLDLRTKCMEFMKYNLSIDTFCDTIALALQHSENELIKLSTDFFAKNLQKIIVTVKWRSFILENPIQSNELLIKALVPNKN